MPTPTIATRRPYRTARRSRSEAALRSAEIRPDIARRRRGVRPDRAASPLPAASPVHRDRTGGRRASRTTAGRRRWPRPVAADRPAPGLRPLLVVPALLVVEGGQEGLRVHQRHQARHVAETEAGQQAGLQREALPEVQGLPGQTKWLATASRRRRSPGCGWAGSRRRAEPGTVPIAWNTAAPPLACPVRLFWETTNSGAPGERPIASARRSCNSVSLGSLASVEVSCLEITAMSSALTPGGAANGPGTESRPPRPAPSARGPGRDRGVHAVGEALRIGHHRQHRQTHLQCEVAAGQQDGAAALGLQESQPAPVVGARDSARR